MAAFAPEVLTTIGSVPVTNTLVNTIFVDAVIFGGVYAVTKNLKRIPGMFQNAVEYIIETMYNFIYSVANKNTPKIFPFVMSFFLFILIANWSGLIPGITAMGLKEEGEKHLIPLMRNLTSDLNATLAFAIISVVVTHYYSIKTIGIGQYLGRYVSINPINFFVGVLEIVSEFTKVISLSFRLFGNIYAGEVVLLTTSSMFAFLLPVPFMMLEVIVGLVQALVFSLLTMVFMAILMTPHKKGGDH
ncbi:MAG: F0F1 ATP synthase subunit A [Candidatus Levybacteria bacterium]|nr:F0F1 ATP synthase subunit A [Candidatus Levybacteria bacterium]